MYTKESVLIYGVSGDGKNALPYHCNICVERRTPIMPLPDTDGMGVDEIIVAVIKCVTYLENGDSFEVKSVRVSDTNNLWYKVQTVGDSPSSTRQGWINEAALFGQKLRIR